MEELQHAARQWAEYDPNPVTSKYVLDLVDSNDTDALQNLFGKGRIGFGTAGLRARMFPGPCNMNDLVVLQASQGLAAYCKSNLIGRKDVIPIAVIGYDHRASDKWNLSSQRFAKITKLVFEQAGIRSVLLDGFVPTPLVAFSIKHVASVMNDRWGSEGKELQCVAGIMVTASHNPKDDDGYKVYLGDGCQIRSPADAEIAASIEHPENLTPWTNYSIMLEDNESITNKVETEILANKYFEALQSKLSTGQYLIHKDNFEDPMWKPPKMMYTAMHGVGAPWAKRSFEAFSFPSDGSFYELCPSQELPDPTFPTVSFPNPEEKGALDLSKREAENRECDIVIANDPDADRLAVAERCRKTGKWTVFTGDQIGVLLGHWMWESVGKSSKQPVAMCASTVSSKMLGAIGAAEGFKFEDTLTGFKWIGSRSNSLREEGYKVILGYEEAIGFCCGDVTSDKDGLSALGIFSEMSMSIYQRKLQVADHLEALYVKYGEFVSNNGYFFCYEPSIVFKIFDDIRNGGNYFSSIQGYKVSYIRDLGYPGFDSSTPDQKPILPTSNSSPMLTLRFENGCVLQLRASGTEPKFKYYIELPGAPGVDRSTVENELKLMSNKLLEELLHPSENGLVKPSGK